MARFGHLPGGVCFAALFAASLCFGTVLVSPLAPAHAATGDVRDNKIKTPPKGARVNVVANKITYDAQTKTAVAIGKVILTYGDYELVATRVTYDQRNDKMTAVGEVRLTEPGGNILEADRASLMNKFKDGFAEHLRLLLTNDVIITADYAVRQDGYLTVYTNVVYNACNNCRTSSGEPLWQLRSRQVTHDEKEGVIYHKDATFEFAGADIITLPYFSHADPTVKRRTGFLSPRFSYASVYGAGVEVPYFWNLAPNYDFTFSPVITSEQGPLLKGEWRHRLANGSYNVDVAGIYQLSMGSDAAGNSRFRGAARTDGEFDLNDNWTWGWDGTLVSDKNFMDKYKIDSRDETIDRLYITGINDRNYFSAQALHFQTLDSDDNQDIFPTALPYIEHSYTFDQPVLGGEFGYDWNLYSISRTDVVFANDPDLPLTNVNLGTDQTRAVANLRWQKQIINSMGQVITPFGNLRGDVYVTENLPDDDDLTQENDTTTRFQPTAGLDMRWPFLTNTEGGQHILTPVTQVIASTDEEDIDKKGNEDAINVNFDATNLFLHDRFSGLDRYEGGTRINTGLLYTFLSENGGFLRASLGESFHVAGKNSFDVQSGLGETSSDLVAALALQPWDSLRFSYQIRMEEDFSAIKTQEAGLSLNFDRFSGSFYYADVDADPDAGRPNNEEQVWGGAGWNFSGGWSLYGGARYDLKESKLIRDTVGVGFNCECFNFRVFYEEDRANEDQGVDRSVQFAIDLKSLGNNIGSVPSQ
ncbi:LPS-assembly protein LptD [Nordella sp. HKS 07]|uniref:LPS-assembly protein LptD n=1 Tax=Nordella sp. HKS 07 TaxID=2712222 RepID=UPI0013E14C17|nr:LPS-assembly protein LptD [Nordella sp. HKS 07]QIG50692.1 LPS-assembly protein LptD [Nordella sp. HKS 07]